MTIVVINEENHGLLGVARDYISAIDFLVRDDWLDRFTEMWDDYKDAWVSLEKSFGSDWLSVISKWDIDTFNDKLSQFQLVLTDVHGM